MNRLELLSYMRAHRLAVVGTVGVDGATHGALVGIAVTDALEIVFDTESDTRKHRNLSRDPRISVTFGGLDEKTLQYEGRAVPISQAGQADAHYLDAYYTVWPEGRDRATRPGIAYWRIQPKWARFSDYNLGPFIAEFAFNEQAEI